MFDDFLVAVAHAVLNSVLSQITQQINKIEEEALTPLKAAIEQVTGGMWVGNGANKFVEEVSSIMIPGIGQIKDTIGTQYTNITYARDVMLQADQTISGLVQSNLTDVFNFF